ncbi:hypothetical protein [Dysgonomonas sp. ZJ709]|uniref:hypothetical protein n=1 Tax=Dysgonomonas sp. ZJ709 TaxID=2709797 RepID=UPI0013EB205D|nr:hypothetical protein [Dysgonomonas sp. ZJ709]
MNLLPFEGFIIPGLHFSNCSIWVLNWETNPTPIDRMVEVWILWHDGKKTCYIDPPNADNILKKYHNFDEIIPADINVSETDSNISIGVVVNGVLILSVELLRKKTLKYKLLNVILKYGNKDKMAEQGKTETGMNYKSIPRRIDSISIVKVQFNNKELTLITNSPIKYSLGDGKSSKKPIISYCTHMLED